MSKTNITSCAQSNRPHSLTPSSSRVCSCSIAGLLPPSHHPITSSTPSRKHTSPRPLDQNGCSIETSHECLNQHGALLAHECEVEGAGRRIVTPLSPPALQPHNPSRSRLEQQHRPLLTASFSVICYSLTLSYPHAPRHFDNSNFPSSVLASQLPVTASTRPRSSPRSIVANRLGHCVLGDLQLDFQAAPT